MSSVPEENPFSGPIGEEYEMLRLICPNAAALARKLGAYVGAWRPGEPLEGLEIGCGTGISTLALLSARPDLRLLAVDSSAKMLEQARGNLASYAASGRVRVIEADALEALKRQPSASLDLIASNYATHNFRDDYRQLVFAEAFRTLKPGGRFVNGDRFAIDDPEDHLALTQREVRHWFKTFAQLGRYDLLEDWVVHLFSDESPQHIMYFALALQLLRTIGFEPVNVEYREGVDTLVVATKPALPERP
jgi:tRNA (cmo5U34)-methyltransferase